MEMTHPHATVKDLEDFLAASYHKTGETIPLSEALDRMAARHPAGSTPTPASVTADSVTGADSIRVFLDAQPVNTSTSGRLTASGEDAVFPQGMDVAVARLFPYVHAETEQKPYFEIVVMLSGSGEAMFDAAPLPLSAGDILVVPPSTPHSVSVSPAGYAFSILMRRSTFDAQFGALMTGADIMSIFFRDSMYGAQEENYLRISADLKSSELLGHLSTLVHECYSSAPLANLCATSRLKLFLAAAYRAHSRSITVMRTVRDEATRADCGVILQYIQQNYRTVRLSTLAKTFHYNETYLSRMLQNYMGMSFTEIVRGIKMSRAEEYLASSGLRVHEIAVLVGYDSVDHFSRTFKATHHMSPQAYRRESVKKNLRKLEK